MKDMQTYVGGVKNCEEQRAEGASGKDRGRAIVVAFEPSMNLR